MLYTYIMYIYIYMCDDMNLLAFDNEFGVQILSLAEKLFMWFIFIFVVFLLT